MQNFANLANIHICESPLKSGALLSLNKSSGVVLESQLGPRGASLHLPITICNFIRIYVSFAWLGDLRSAGYVLVANHG